MTKKQHITVQKQRITVLIDPDLVYHSKVYALRNKMVLGELVAQALQQVLKNNAPTDS
jgi:hypothetical protein